VKAFLFVNRSCNRRQEEITLIRRFLLINDWIECEDSKQVDLIIFFTCAFCHSKVVDMLKEITTIRAIMKEGSELIVGSCLPKTDKESLEKIFGGRTINPTDFSALNNLPDIKINIEAMPKIFGKNAICPSPDIGSRYSASNIISKDFFFRGTRLLLEHGPNLTLKRIIRKFKIGFSNKRIGIFVSAGCLRQCSYCVIRFAIGGLRSKPLDIIMELFSKGLKLGYKKFELYADSIGDYGLDINTNLGELFDRILNTDKHVSIGIYDLHPFAFIKYFEEIMLLLKASKIHYIYVPLQSGNERILKLMNRSCDMNDLLLKLLEVRKFHNVFMQTSIIVGFPSETDEEFSDTVSFLNKIRFNEVYVHFYSDMPNTDSSKLSGKIDKNTMLRRLDEINSAAINHNFVETQHEWENISMIS